MKRALLWSFAFAAASFAAGCKTSPETAPPGASAPVATTSPLPDPAPPAAADSAPAAGGTRTYPSETTSISAAVGETFVVALPDNITVPFKWRLEPAPDAKLLTLGEEKHVDQPPANCPGCTGYGGTRLFSFAAAGAGKLTLHFALRPLTDPKGAAQKEVSIAVEIK